MLGCTSDNHKTRAQLEVRAPILLLVGTDHEKKKRSHDHDLQCDTARCVVARAKPTEASSHQNRPARKRHDWNSRSFRPALPHHKYLGDVLPRLTELACTEPGSALSATHRFSTPTLASTTARALTRANSAEIPMSLSLVDVMGDAHAVENRPGVESLHLIGPQECPERSMDG